MRPNFWNNRYASGDTPWVLGGIPQALDAFLRRTKPGAVLIPGCGNDQNAIRAFVEAGFVTTAIDFSPAAVAQAAASLGKLGDRLLVADFFQHEFGVSRFDMIYERTFLCALPRSLREQYAGRVAELLRPGGVLGGFFFYGEEDPEGPPFPLPREKANTLFVKKFRLRHSEKVTDSIQLFTGREEWQEWERV
ncbi:MAG: TPMT family class I SAM-dependent methyltransferase [Verrucomicrobiota bacterium]|nr:TPMT family class I SAM-dependent methyltransferase [Verrucomicrobiota bacterium]